MRYLLLCLVILFAPPVSASPLVQVQVNGIYLYFEESEEDLARLFPVRGFDSNLLEAPAAAAASAEVFWPLANLQTGYKSLPFFLHRLRLGTFVDAGYASIDARPDDLLVGAGFELLTSLELGWGGFSTFRIGVAWPLVQADDLGQEGPVIVFQLGRPL